MMKIEWEFQDYRFTIILLGNGHNIGHTKPQNVRRYYDR